MTSFAQKWTEIQISLQLKKILCNFQVFCLLFVIVFVNNEVSALVAAKVS